MKIKKRPARAPEDQKENVLRSLLKDICEKRGIKPVQLAKLAGRYALKVNGGVNNAVSQYMKVNVVNNITRPSITYKMFLIAMRVLEVVNVKFHVEVEFKNGDIVTSEKNYPLSRHDEVLTVNQKEKENEKD